MNTQFRDSILRYTGAQSFTIQEQIQELWSGYGKILRLSLKGAEKEQVIIKQVKIPNTKNHPRGWHSDLGHQRKLKSYAVEANFYQSFAQLSKARLPKFLGADAYQEERLLVLEDLDAAGFPLRKTRLNWSEMRHCIAWLAQFHASYLGQNPIDLWEIGSYWHLATRPEELAVLKDQELKEAAPQIDAKLNGAKYQTLVHGDAKLANFCFGQDGQVAAVDFQYVGGGCGMKDLAYFVGSCLSEEECERMEAQILDTYFNYFQANLPSSDAELEEEWRALYPVAWADFHRFLKGWSPGHWKINSYSERITQQVVNSLK